jgi:hypothetical protein
MDRKDIEQLLNLADRRDALRAEWDRRVAAGAAGTLAILAGLPPELPPGDLPRWLLAATWILLGLGILCGLGAAFAPVNQQARLVVGFASHMQGFADQRAAGKNPPPVLAKPAWIFRACRAGMVLSLAAAVVCLVSFAVMRTLAA